MNNTKRRAAGWGAVAISALLAACGGGGDNPPASDTTARRRRRSDARNSRAMAIPAASIGLPTTGGAVTTAAVVAPSGTGATAVPEYCLVNGSISPVDSSAPKILFRVALPTVWNSKVVMFGGGGFNGTIPSVAGNVPNGPSTSRRRSDAATRPSPATPATRRTRSARRTRRRSSTTRRSATSAAMRSRRPATPRSS